MRTLINIHRYEGVTRTMDLVYMGCSDVSEFEHIYGQIVTTPSCVYAR